MSDPKRIGGTKYHTETIRIRNAANEAREALSKLLEGNVGPLTANALVAKAALQLGIIIDAAANLQSIGKEAKKERTKEEQ